MVEGAANRPPPDKGVASRRRAGGSSLLELLSDSAAHRFKVVQDVAVGETNQLHAKPNERIRPAPVVALGRVVKVTIAVDFYGQSLARTIKVDDVETERFLPRELFRPAAQELMPQLAFGYRCVMPQPARARRQACTIRNEARHVRATHD